MFRRFSFIGWNKKQKKNKKKDDSWIPGENLSTSRMDI